MRTFVYSELKSELKDKSHVMYCYSGNRSRGALAIFDGDNISIIFPNNYVLSDDESDFFKDFSNFELWAFLHEMSEEEYDKRAEAVTRLFDVYCNLYNFVPLLREFPFIVDDVPSPK